MSVSKRLRYEILRRDNHACRYCGDAAPGVKLNVDHVIPKALGGSDKPTNLVTSCAACNAGKTSSMPDAQPVEDVDQDAFRQAVAARARPTHDPETGMPTCWSFREVELAIAEFAWGHAWTISTDGQSPSTDQYNEFLDQRGNLADQGRSAPEIICAAVLAGLTQASRLTWGLGAAQLRHAPISGEEHERARGAVDLWLAAWRERHGASPSPELVNEFKGRVIQAVRDGRTRDQIMRAAKSAGFSGNANVDYLAYHVSCEDADEKAGGC
jgi:hypothetical protein